MTKDDNAATHVKTAAAPLGERERVNASKVEQPASDFGYDLDPVAERNEEYEELVSGERCRRAWPGQRRCSTPNSRCP